MGGHGNSILMSFLVWFGHFCCSCRLILKRNIHLMSVPYIGLAWLLWCTRGWSNLWCVYVHQQSQPLTALVTKSVYAALEGTNAISWQCECHNKHENAEVWFSNPWHENKFQNKEKCKWVNALSLADPNSYFPTSLLLFLATHLVHIPMQHLYHPPLVSPY